MMTFVRRTFLRSLATAAIALLVVTAAQAGPRRARLSKDLVDRLAAGDQSSTRVIVSGSREQIDTLATRYGVRIYKTLRNGAVLEVTGGQLDALTQDPGVDSVSSDAPVRRMMAVTTSAIGADQVWSGALQGISSYSGRGIGVAIVDSGVGNHRDLAGRVVASVNFTDSSSGDLDGYGHGTHVAGIISGGAAGQRGVAPGAHIVSLRAISADGSGTTSDVIEAIDWAVAHQREYNIRIINLSLGKPVLESYKDEVEINLQVYPARPRTIVPPSAFVDAIREVITYSGHLVQRRPTADIIVVHGLFDSKEAADQKDAFVDGFLDWFIDQSHAAGANTLLAIIEAEDIPDYVNAWAPPAEQRTYYATRIGVEGLALTG